jgi:hypothetical protein
VIGQLHAPAHFLREGAFFTNWIGGLVGLNDIKNRKFSTLSVLELRPVVRPARRRLLYRLQYCSSIYIAAYKICYHKIFRYRPLNGLLNIWIERVAFQILFGKLGLKSHPRDQLSPASFFLVFLFPSRRIIALCFNGHGCALCRTEETRM